MFRSGDARGELAVLPQVHGDLRQPPEAAHGLKGRQRDGHFRLVVVVFVDLGVHALRASRMPLPRTSPRGNVAATPSADDPRGTRGGAATTRPPSRTPARGAARAAFPRVSCRGAPGSRAPCPRSALSGATAAGRAGTRRPSRARCRRRASSAPTGASRAKSPRTAPTGRWRGSRPPRGRIERRGSRSLRWRASRGRRPRASSRRCLPAAADAPRASPRPCPVARPRNIRAAPRGGAATRSRNIHMAPRGGEAAARPQRRWTPATRDPPLPRSTRRSALRVSRTPVDPTRNPRSSKNARAASKAACSKRRRGRRAADAPGVLFHGWLEPVDAALARFGLLLGRGTLVPRRRAFGLAAPALACPASRIPAETGFDS